MKKETTNLYPYASSTNDFVLALKDSETSVESKQKMTKVAHVTGLIFTYLFLIFMGVIIIFPFYWMIITSLKNPDEITWQVPSFFPQFGLYWENYAEAVRQLNFGVLLKNTLIVGIISTIGTVITTILAAYAFAKLNFKGKNVLFAILLGSMMIPGEMMVITNFISVSRLGWINTVEDADFGYYVAMIVPFWVSIFYIYLLRQNFKQIPNELYLAAKVDGKSDWAYLWKVMVPLAMPTLTTIFILKLMGAWNSYVWPQLILGSGAKHAHLRLITNGLRETFQSSLPGQFGAQMAGTVIVTVPLLLLFIFFRKYIMRGVGRAGIKG